MNKRKNVGWVEQSETQQKQGFFVLGFVPQPNLSLNTVQNEQQNPDVETRFIAS